MITKEVTSVDVSNKLKELNVVESSMFFRDWTGAKEDEVEEWGKGKKFYGVDNVNCYTIKELGKILIRYATENSHLKTNLENTQKTLTDVYERFKGWGGIVEDFAKIHQKDGHPASENLSDMQGHFLVELWKAIKQALGLEGK